MSKRLQVILTDEEFSELQRAADGEGVTVSAWVRGSLRWSRRRSAGGDVEDRLAAVRAASRQSFPTGDVAEVLHDIQRGYLTS